jgi:hypothetical protein
MAKRDKPTKPIGNFLKPGAEVDVRYEWLWDTGHDGGGQWLSQVVGTIDTVESNLIILKNIKGVPNPLCIPLSCVHEILLKAPAPAGTKPGPIGNFLKRRGATVEVRHWFRDRFEGGGWIKLQGKIDTFKPNLIILESTDRERLPAYIPLAPLSWAQIELKAWPTPTGPRGHKSKAARKKR